MIDRDESRLIARELRNARALEKRSDPRYRGLAERRGPRPTTPEKLPVSGPRLEDSA